MSSPVFIDNKSCKNLVMLLWKRDFFGLVNYFAEHRGIFRFIKVTATAKSGYTANLKVNGKSVSGTSATITVINDVTITVDYTKTSSGGSSGGGSSSGGFFRQ